MVTAKDEARSAAVDRAPNITRRLDERRFVDLTGRKPQEKKLRLRYRAGRLHGLGPGPLFYFLADIERGKALRPLLEEYASLDPRIIAAYGGALAPSFRVIRGDRP
jgi:hypothetical protein